MTVIDCLYVYCLLSGLSLELDSSLLVNLLKYLVYMLFAFIFCVFF